MRLELREVAGAAAAMREVVRDGERAVTRGVHGAGAELKAAWRAQIQRAGLGRRLANSIRSQGYPREGESIRAAALVWSRASHIVGTFDDGAVVRARGGRFLAIPLPAAGRGRGGRRPSPREFEARTGIRLRFIRRRSGGGILVAEGRLNKRGRAMRSRSKTGRGLASIPVFVLVPQVRLEKRLDLDRDTRRIEAEIPGRIVAAWRD
ncbi:hypothetical protein SAMN05216257_10489 [Meinhardsimonia xiamenensis]|jgi:hypothetical protein|uniref:Uncharacterized protein n=1 Tax=Meinhardsimonia xiamenensis TaxID=990712 RepID=A0A1G9DZH1_9RHOB|nr:DUF6441 family protein [Meinhardsimonia xiamenensis]PRX29008.1 hypothetical protein LV81_02952 [Meinhardsimonia xiamenensis]SDK69291.1 hypothetical protein SAMN05216257_10489 [Meinhardsimonia xiamenensis]